MPRNTADRDELLEDPKCHFIERRLLSRSGRVSLAPVAETRSGTTGRWTLRTSAGLSLSPSLSVP